MPGLPCLLVTELCAPPNVIFVFLKCRSLCAYLLINPFPSWVLMSGLDLQVLLELMEPNQFSCHVCLDGFPSHWEERTIGLDYQYLERTAWQSGIAHQERQTAVGSHPSPATFQLMGPGKACGLLSLTRMMSLSRSWLAQGRYLRNEGMSVPQPLLYTFPQILFTRRRKPRYWSTQKYSSVYLFPSHTKAEPQKHVLPLFPSTYLLTLSTLLCHHRSQGEPRNLKGS